MEAGVRTEAVLAVDPGTFAANGPQVPMVNRDPKALFGPHPSQLTCENSRTKVWLRNAVDEPLDEADIERTFGE